MAVARASAILMEWVRSAPIAASLEEYWRDVRVASRGLARSPTFSLVTLLTLALGIGANAAIFTVVNAVLIRPLPYPAASRLVRLWETLPPAPGNGPEARPRRSPRITVSEIQALQPTLTTVTHLSFTGPPSLMTFSGDGASKRMQGMRVAPRYFETLGMSARLGRTFGATEEAPDADAVLILSHAAWQTHFSGRPDIIAHTVTLASSLGPSPGTAARRYEIVGVMPEGFDAANSQVEFWLPVAWNLKASGALVARLAGNATLATAQAELGTALGTLRATGEQARYDVEPALAGVVEPIRPALLMLMGASAFVLLIACVNVANLVLARMNEQRREIAVRTALGAGRRRLIRYLAMESLLLAVVSGALGVLVASMSLRALRSAATTISRIDLGADSGFPRLNEVSVDASVLVFVAITSVLAGALIGVLPAMAYAKPGREMEALRASASTGHAGFSLFRRGRSRAVLVLIEVALTMVLLVGAGLMIHSFGRLSRVDPGFDPTGVMTFQVALPPGRYPLARMKTFADQVVERVRRVPGVDSAAHGQLPMVLLVDRFGLGRAPDVPRPYDREAPVVRLVSPGYFTTLGIAITRGRSFTEQDGTRGARVVLINEALARAKFPREDPIGVHIYIGPDEVPWEIVGVTASVRQYGLDQEPTAQVFALTGQWPGANVFPLGPYFAIRTRGDASGLLRHVRDVATALDPEAGVFNVATMDHLVANRMSRPRLYALLLGTFAGLAAALAFVGIYGVVAYTVGQRRREIGIRMALGAAPSRVLRLVLAQSLSVAAAGIVIGLLAAGGLTQSLRDLLFGIEPLDLPTFASVAAGFALIVSVAAWLPARRATTAVPMMALRGE